MTTEGGAYEDVRCVHSPQRGPGYSETAEAFGCPHYPPAQGPWKAVSEALVGGAHDDGGLLQASRLTPCP